MSPFREKAQIFFTGLSIGLLIAGAFFILKLDDYFKELSIYKKVSQTFLPQAEAPAVDTLKNDAGKEPAARVKRIKIAEPARMSVTEQEETQQPVTDTIRSSRSDTTNAAAAGDDIVIKKDELLTAKTIEVTNLGSPVKPAAKDSLLQKVSGIKDDKITDRFNVEFWESPLHYKGYKLGKSRMVLYGFTPGESLKLYRYDDALYLKNAGVVYRLDYTTDYRPYERVTDEQVIGRLK